MTTDDLDQLMPIEEQRAMTMRAVYLDTLRKSAAQVAQCGCMAHRYALDLAITAAAFYGASKHEQIDAYEQGRKEAQSG